jgi:hypothetical protein
MLQFILRWLVEEILFRLLILLLLPVALTVATPVILIRALVLRVRGEQRFTVAVLDSYGWMWDGFITAFTWPFVSETDRLAQIHRRSSNQALGPTAGRRAERLKDELG